jgi:hypothetical protein
MRSSGIALPGHLFSTRYWEQSILSKIADKHGIASAGQRIDDSVGGLLLKDLSVPNPVVFQSGFHLLWAFATLTRRDCAWRESLPPAKCSTRPWSLEKRGETWKR